MCDCVCTSWKVTCCVMRSYTNTWLFSSTTASFLREADKSRQRTGSYSQTHTFAQKSREHNAMTNAQIHTYTRKHTQTCCLMSLTVKLLSMKILNTLPFFRPTSKPKCTKLRMQTQ